MKLTASQWAMTACRERSPRGCRPPPPSRRHVANARRRRPVPAWHRRCCAQRETARQRWTSMQTSG
eukprot:799946-Prymnesium_polylepis.1